MYLILIWCRCESQILHEITKCVFRKRIGKVTLVNLHRLSSKGELFIELIYTKFLPFILQASSVAVWDIVWALGPRPLWAAGAKSTGTSGAEGAAKAKPGVAAGRGRMTPRARRTCPGEFYPPGRASWTSSAVNSWADTHPPTTTTTSNSSRLVTARDLTWVKYSFCSHTRREKMSLRGHFARAHSALDIGPRISFSANLIFSE